MNTELYFSFGSNMDREQMKKRTPLAEYVGVGHVVDHDLVFNRKGSYRPGGVASIVPKAGVNAYGVIWAISDDELAEMDRIETLRLMSAWEKWLLGKMERISRQVYVAFPQGNILADQPYLELIIAAAEKANLPTEWIERLRKYRTT